MTGIFYALNIIIENELFRISISLVAFLIKAVILTKLITTKNICKSVKNTHLLLVITLFCSLFEDISWIMYSLHMSIPCTSTWEYMRLFIKFSWITTIIRDTTLTLFLECLSNHARYSRRYIICIAASSFFVLGFIVALVGQIAGISSPWIIFFTKASSIYTHIFLLLPTCFMILYRMRRVAYPRIFKKQMTTTIYIVIIPYIIIEILFLTIFSYSRYLCIMNILLPVLICYCARKLIDLRFLNIHNYVQTPTRFSFLKNFTEVLDGFSQSSTIAEISLITKNLFYKAFNLPSSTVHVYIIEPSMTKISIDNECKNTAAIAVAYLLKTTNIQLLKIVYQAKILIYDDIDFTHFYESNQDLQNLLFFLDSIKAEVFIPIYDQQKIIGCIAIDKFAKQKSFLWPYRTGRNDYFFELSRKYYKSPTKQKLRTGTHKRDTT